MHWIFIHNLSIYPCTEYSSIIYLFIPSLYLLIGLSFNLLYIHPYFIYLFMHWIFIYNSSMFVHALNIHLHNSSIYPCTDYSSIFHLFIHALISSFLPILQSFIYIYIYLATSSFFSTYHSYLANLHFFISWV